MRETNDFFQCLYTVTEPVFKQSTESEQFSKVVCKPRPTQDAEDENFAAAEERCSLLLHGSTAEG